MILEDLLSQLFFSVDATLFVSLGFIILITKGIIHFWPRTKKYSFVIHILGLIILVVLTGFSSSIVAGKGYDCPYFVYVTDMMSRQDISIIRYTDKPVMYLVTYALGEFYGVSGRLSVPYAGILFSCLFIISTYILGYFLTKDFSIALGASLIAMQSNFMENLALNFIGNLFGLCLLYLGLSTFKEKKYVLSVPLFILIYFAHRFTFVVGISIVIIYLFSNLKFDKKIIPHILFLVLGGLMFLIIGEYTGFYVFNIIKSAFIGGTIIQHSFYDYLQVDWLKESLLIYGLYAIGMLVAISEKSKLMLIWVSSVFLTILVFPVFSGRILLYLPFPILGALGLKWIIDHIKRPQLRTFLYVSICYLFLFSTINHYNENKVTNLRYRERGPFVWDTFFVEVPQLIWISENYDLNEIVVITDIGTTPWGIVQTWNTHPHLKPGVHFRLIAEIGPNVFVGKISDLIQNGYRKVDGDSSIEWTGYPIFGSWDIDLEGKTLLVPDTIYNLKESEMGLLEESAYPGLYLVREELVDG